MASLLRCSSSASLLLILLATCTLACVAAIASPPTSAPSSPPPPPPTLSAASSPPPPPPPAPSSSSTRLLAWLLNWIIYISDTVITAINDPIGTLVVVLEFMVASVDANFFLSSVFLAFAMNWVVPAVPYAVDRTNLQVVLVIVAMFLVGFFRALFGYWTAN